MSTTETPLVSPDSGQILKSPDSGQELKSPVLNSVGVSSAGTSSAGMSSARVPSAREQGRVAFGVTGNTTRVSLRSVIGTGGWYPLVALSLLAFADQLAGYAFFVLGPDIGRALGVSRSAVATTSALRLLCLFAATIPVASFVQNQPRRAACALISAAGSIIAAILVGTAPDFGTVTLAWAIGGFVDGAVQAVHRPLLIDSYPPTGRVRLLSTYRGAVQFGGILGPLLVAALTRYLHLSWRGVFIAIAGCAVPFAVYAAQLKDPGFGRFDEAVLRDQARTRALDGAHAMASADTDADVGLGTSEAIRRVLAMPSIRRILSGFVALGVTFTPLVTYVSYFLEERWGLNATGRALFLPLLPLGSIVVLLLVSRRAESLFQATPGKLLVLAGRTISIGVVLIGISVFIPSGLFGVMAVLMALGFGAFSMVYPLLDAVQLSVLPTRLRPYATALAGLFAAGIGGIGGIFLFGSIDRRFGTAAAICMAIPPGLIAGRLMASAASLVEDDLNATVEALIEEEERKVERQSGAHLPLLSARNINFSYGTVQVLFDVDFTVDDGEIVALLGTNGAGKSTLLRVISGLALPQRGTVRLYGSDITFIDAERRVPLGIAQIPGGKAVFGPLSVAENLRLYGHTVGRQSGAVDRGIDATFAAFPKLFDRRDQLASTLSGGEQQMLALGKALLLQPRLLAIDELSLGLAPVIVGDLLEMVRTINASGTAVVLVEQSVNVALSIAQRAYFMEKGEVRFEGPAKDLLSRTDLLRAVFLEGTAAGLGSSSGHPV
jgi:ABC-type branched-subunit amino acid transport system ATPase component/MFS family permease